MRKRIATTAALLLALTLVSGAPRIAAAETALGTSTWSLEIGTDLGTGDQDGSFAIRKHSGSSSAFRFGIEVDLGKSEGEGTRTDTGSPDEDVTQSFEFTNTAFSIQYMRFASIRENVTATFAVGPVVEFERGTQRIEQRVGLPSFDGFEFRTSSTAFGLDLGLGVEWFFNPRFSLGGQSGLRFVTGSGDQVDIDRSGTAGTYSKTETALDVDVTELSVGTARIQLTGYF
jgi:hypothetical protein